jgi:hypothetical protein
MRHGWRAAGLLSFGLLGAAPAQAFDIRDVQYFRATGYRSCQKCDLAEANLQDEDADLFGANLQRADLRGANLQSANLGGANLQRADLRGANLQSANLGGANLQSADLRGTDITNAQLAYANLADAIYAPASPPPNGYVAGIQGLRSVVIPTSGDLIGLVQLRKLLQEAGLPEGLRQDSRQQV